MPSGDVCLHVKPDPHQQYYGDDTPIMRMPDDNGLVVFSCKHIIQNADAKSGKEEKICNKIFQGTFSQINIGTFRSLLSARVNQNLGLFLLALIVLSRVSTSIGCFG